MEQQWQTFVGSLNPGRWVGSGPSDKYGRVREFVENLPRSEKIPLLLSAYRNYKELGPCPRDFNDEHYFRSSSCSILISTLLASGLKPTQKEACDILRCAFHYCGHGSDVEAPILLAEKAFWGRAYSQKVFEAARAYLQILRPLRTVKVQAARRRLNWLLWHDVQTPMEKCWTERIRRAIARMDRDEAFAWQWLLRNVDLWAQGKPRNAWLQEGQDRLARLGSHRFVRRIRQWFEFGSGDTIRISPSGSDVLRLLVWYGSLVDRVKVLPILTRLDEVDWDRRGGSESKVLSALTWLAKLL